MLIYVNQFELDGDYSNEEAFNLISKWLSKVLRNKVTIEFLKSGNEKSYSNGAKIRTYVANDLEPYMFSILFSHPDNTVIGRQWVTEIGVKSEANKTIISVLLETSDISTRVKELPKTTKPNLVAFIHNSSLLARDTIGLRVKPISNDRDELRALDYEISRPERDFPLVLISADANGKYLLNSKKLQEQLIGLAQVIQINNVNSWVLEENIGKVNCVWGGAIRIIYPTKIRKTKLFRKTELQKIADSFDNIYHEFLSFITHTNNGFNKKKHFSPAELRAKRYRDQTILLKDKLSNNSDYESLAVEAFKQLEEQDGLLSQHIQEFQQKQDDLELEKLELQEKIQELENELNRLKYSKSISTVKTNSHDIPLLMYGDESDLYPSEIKDLIIQIVNSHFENPNMAKNARAYKILEDFLEKNKSSNEALHRVEKIKQLFKSYTGVTSKFKSELRELGLEIDETGEHNAIRFIDDDRFVATIAKTPSDVRALKNMPGHIKKALFY